MKSIRKDISGQRFSRLVALSYVRTVDRRAIWKCQCDCGSVIMVAGKLLRSGNTKSCGCLKLDVLRQRSITHGHTVGSIAGRARSREYTTWRNMLARCENPKNTEWENYGGRGIAVCERWHTFEVFLKDMGLKPLGLTLERKDTNGNYCKENCCWATGSQQAYNRREHAHV